MAAALGGTHGLFITADELPAVLPELERVYQRSVWEQRPSEHVANIVDAGRAALALARLEPFAASGGNVDDATATAPRWLSVKDLAEVLDVAQRTVRDWALAGRWPDADKTGRDWRFPPTVLETERKRS